MVADLAVHLVVSGVALVIEHDPPAGVFKQNANRDFSFRIMGIAHDRS